MYKRKINKKLLLNKKTISNLNHLEKKKIFGGGEAPDTAVIWCHTYGRFCSNDACSGGACDEPGGGTQTCVYVNTCYSCEDTCNEDTCA